MDRRRNKPLFEPRRVIVPDGTKKRRKHMTVARKQQLMPSYEPQPLPEKQKQQMRDRYAKNKDSYIAYRQNRVKHNVRYKKVYFRLCVADAYKKLGQVKICTGCKKELAYSLFDYCWHRKQGAPRKTYCFRCRQKLNKSYYNKNKKHIKQKSEDRYEQNKEKFKQHFKVNYIRRTYGVIATLDKSNTICLPNGLQIAVGERVTKRKVQG